uniref:Uncharacterized protein n=1 Tax=uncultured prokaryote TaxID=198431 RepID=A0A0H5Q5F0_9ZZZZ|nr:hypothetical protein [uncultured prokaryote]
MTIQQPSLLTSDDLAAELASARRQVTSLLQLVLDFTVLAHAQPWRYLDDLLADLRAASITVATLEQLQAVS